MASAGLRKGDDTANRTQEMVATPPDPAVLGEHSSSR